MKLAIYCLAALAALGFFKGAGLQAALVGKDVPVSSQEAMNPQPADDDLILPMPCQGQMVFKVVGAQTEGYLWDMETQFGCDDCERQGQDYYDRRYSAAVSGPFTAADLPAAWQEKLPRATVGQYHYFLIGKYEVTNYQWNLVMNQTCPAVKDTLSPEEARPKTDISWFEALDFSRKYTEWLLKNAPEALPRFAGDDRNVGYLRLPTEAEWEYAARGGQAVPRPSLREEEFFPLEAGLNFADYAVFRAEGPPAPEGLAAVGRRRPNPLGLYDTAGNAAEMVLSNFHFSLGGRLHGSAGGFVRKGGGFLSSLPEIMPGRREEAAFFLADGANRGRDLGLRLAISGINTPAGGRPQALSEEWRRFGENEAYLTYAAGQNPLTELDRGLAQISSNSPEGHKSLERLRGLLKDDNIAQERRNAAEVENLVRNALFMAEAIERTAASLMRVAEIAGGLRQLRDANLGDAARRYALEQSLAGAEELTRDLEAELEANLGFYRGNLDKGLAYPEALFQTQLKVVQADFIGDDPFDQAMRRYGGLYDQHLKLLRQGRTSGLSRAALMKDLTQAGDKP